MHIIYAAHNYDCPFYARHIEDIIQEIIDAVTNKNKDIIIFSNVDEDFCIPTISKIHIILKYLSNVKLNCQYIITTGGYYYEPAYNHECTKLKYKEKLIIAPVHYCHLTWMRRCQLLYPLYDQVWPNSEPKIREKKFLCFNRVPREHRLQLINELLKEDLVKHSYYSFYISSNEAASYDDYPSIKEHADIFPLKLNLEGLYGERQGIELIPDDFKYFANSYFSVVPETTYYYNYPSEVTVFPTEKIYKCMSLKHPFIMVSRPKSLQNLRELGYKTFHPYIDESYDLIENNDTRMTAIVNEIKRLCSFSDQQWLEWQSNVKDIIEHNFNVFMNPKRFSLFNISDLIEGHDSE